LSKILAIDKRRGRAVPPSYALVEAWEELLSSVTLLCLYQRFIVYTAAIILKDWHVYHFDLSMSSGPSQFEISSPFEIRLEPAQVA